MKYILLPFRLLFRFMLLIFGFFIYAPFMLIKSWFFGEKKPNVEYKLHNAVNPSDIETIKLLLENGADIDSLNNLRSTPLKIAVQNNNIVVVELLLEYGANTNIDHPLVTIGYYENINIGIVKLLLEHGADARYCNNYGDNLIHTSIKTGREDIIDLLLEYGAEINGNNYDHGDTPLHQQSYTGTRETLEILLEKGADIDCTNNKGNTALSLASCQEIMDIDRVKVLLEYGADVNIQNHEGTTALITASLRGHINVVDLLLNYGADKNIECIYGTEVITALSAAKSNGHKEIQNLLQNS